MAENEPYLFQKVLAERDAEVNFFENLINDGNSLVIFMVTTTDEKLIDFYKYLLKNKKQLEYRQDPENEARLQKINHILESISEDHTIKNYLKAEEEKRDKEIAEIMQRLEEKKKRKNMGPIRKLINRTNKK